MGGIETEKQQIPPQHQEHYHHQRRYQQRLPDVRTGDAQHVAKKDVGEIDIAAHLRHKNKPKGKETGEHQANHRVFLNPRLLLDEADQGHRSHPEDKCPQGERQTQGVGNHHSRHDRMGDGIAHQGPALEGHIAGEQTAAATNQGTDQ